MKKTLRLLLAGWTSIIWYPAFGAGNKTLRVVPYVLGGPAQCPQGSFAGDGCPNATAAGPGQFKQANAFQPGGFFNATAATTANYSAVRPPWNVACVDFGCGNYTPALATCTDATWQGPTHCLLDPATHPPAGCIYGTSSTGGNKLTCGGSNSVWAGIVQHYNFGPVNGHSCTALAVGQNTGTGTPLTSVLIDDISWFNDNGLCSNAIGGGTPAFLALTTCCAFTSGVTVSNFVLDGNSSVWDTKWGGTSPGSTPCDGATTQCNPWHMVEDNNNPMLYEYGVFKNSAATMMSPPQSVSTAQVVIKWSMVQTWCNRTPNCHAEWYDGQASTVGTRNITFDHSIMTAEGSPSGNAQFGPAPMYLCANAHCIVDQYNFTNNVVVNPYIGGLTAQSITYSGCEGAPPTGGSDVSPLCGGGPGNIFYVTKTNGPSMAHGINLCANGAATYHRIPGPYQTTPLAVIDEWGMDQQNGAYYPGFSTSGTCSNSTAFANVANFAVQDAHAISPLGTATITNNYLDVSSQGGTTPGVFHIGPENNTATFQGTINVSGGTATLTSNISISLAAVGEYITWTGQADACSANVLNCPRTATGGSGTSFVLNGYTGPASFGPITMVGQYPTYCNTPATFSNNHDMSGTGITSINGWTGGGIGC